MPGWLGARLHYVRLLVPVVVVPRISFISFLSIRSSTECFHAFSFFDFFDVWICNFCDEKLSQTNTIVSVKYKFIKTTFIKKFMWDTFIKTTSIKKHFHQKTIFITNQIESWDRTKHDRVAKTTLCVFL